MNKLRCQEGDLNSLKKLQQSFRDFICKNPSEEKNHFFKSLLPLKKIPLETARSIYRQNHFEVLKGSLLESYPVCAFFLTDKVFHKLTGHYIASHPSQSAFLFQYGENFPSFLKKSLLQSSFPFLSDLARFEREIKKLKVKGREKKSSSFSLPSLLSLLREKGDSLSLSLSQNVHLFSSDYPVFELWRRLREPPSSKKLLKENLKSSSLSFSLKKKQVSRLKQKSVFLFSKSKKEQKKEHLLIKKESLKGEEEMSIQKIDFEIYSLSYFLKKSMSLIELKKHFEKKFHKHNDTETQFFSSLSFLMEKEILRVQEK